MSVTVHDVHPESDERGYPPCTAAAYRSHRSYGYQKPQQDDRNISTRRLR